MAQTITVNGTPMLVSDDISFPFWLESGSSISPEVPVSSISVLEFNIVPNNNGNDMVFNQVISVTEVQTVPEGKTWKVESILMENQGFEVGNTNTSLFIPTSISSINIVMDEPAYDSTLFYWAFNASILPSGGNSITTRGFCYSSINEHPTVYDNITNSGSGTGSFEMLLNNVADLELNSSYYIRSYATSLDGIAYSNVQSFTVGSQTLPEIGEYFQGGVLFYVDETGHHGLVASVEDLGVFEWGCYQFSLSGADGTAIGTSYQNSLDIVEGCSQTPIAASVALAYETEGYSDWYLPSKDELVEMYNTIGSGGTQGNIAGFQNDYYWSSSEYTTNKAWFVDFVSGDSEFNWLVYYSNGTNNNSTSKNKDWLVRPIRTF